MSIYIPNPNCDCRLCNYADKSDQFTKNNQIYCPVINSKIDFDKCTDCGTQCEDRDTNQDWLNIERALRVGREYVRTGDVRVFTRREKSREEEIGEMARAYGED